MKSSPFFLTADIKFLDCKGSVVPPAEVLCEERKVCFYNLKNFAKNIKDLGWAAEECQLF